MNRRGRREAAEIIFGKEQSRFLARRFFALSAVKIILLETQYLAIYRIHPAQLSIVECALRVLHRKLHLVRCKFAGTLHHLAWLPDEGRRAFQAYRQSMKQVLDNLWYQQADIK